MSDSTIDLGLSDDVEPPGQPEMELDYFSRTPELFVEAVRRFIRDAQESQEERMDIDEILEVIDRQIGFMQYIHSQECIPFFSFGMLNGPLIADINARYVANYVQLQMVCLITCQPGTYSKVPTGW